MKELKIDEVTLSAIMVDGHRFITYFKKWWGDVKVGDTRQLVSKTFSRKIRIDILIDSVTDYGADALHVTFHVMLIAVTSLGSCIVYSERVVTGVHQIKNPPVTAGDRESRAGSIPFPCVKNKAYD